MDQRRAAGALLALAVCIASTAAAPTASNQTALDLYDGSAEGCYYNFQHYGEGDRIMTNEPCLNCTCHNRMLMCYLRVCPFTKPIGQDCTVEKRADQCCPIVTCPDVPVDLLTSTSTTSPAEYGATGVGKLDKYGCSIHGKYFPEGSKVPPTPNKPCEHCYCIRNMTTCVMQECTLHVDGCTPIYHKDVCCPVRYSCDHPEDTTLLLDDMTTTVRPTPGFLLTTTTLSPVTQMSQDCVHDDKIFSDGALIKTEKACEHCYCMKGDIVCVVQECGTPMENEGKNCTSQPPREGQCCPDTYICEGDEVTTEPPSDYSTQSQLEELTTISPPRRVGVEGSGYRNEPDEPVYTESPLMETEPEGSGYEQSTEPAAIDDSNLLTSEAPEISSEPIDDSVYSSRTTVRTPTLEEVEKTTEPDKGLNTVPSDASDEEMYKPAITEKSPFEEPKVTETILTTSPEGALLSEVTTKHEESTTESAFRKEDTLGETTELYDQGKPEKDFTLGTDIEKETEDDVTSSTTKAPFIEELEKQTTLSPEFTQKDIEQGIPSKESMTESTLEVTTSVDVKPTDILTTDSEEVSQTETTQPTVEKVDVHETTGSELNEIEDTSTTLSPGRIPGEGDCLLNDVTYRNNSNVPSSNNCHTSCRCVSSIIKCDPIICSPPPEYMDNCQPTYDSADSCCPTYVCHTGETMPPQPHSQMSGTDSPLPSSPIECHGDECEVRKDDNVPVVGDCGSAGCSDGHSGIPEKPSDDCHDGKCSLPVQPCTDGNCQEILATHCENGKCGIEHEIPVKNIPLCENESECKETVPENTSCDGEECVKVNVECSGTDCSTDVVKQPCIDGNCPETPAAHCENGKCDIEPQIIPVKDIPLCENESDCKGTIPEVPLCEGEGCVSVNVECSGTDCSLDVTKQPVIPGQKEGSCEGDCKTTGDKTIEPCTETSCRRKETGEVDSSLPSDCLGSDCIQQVPSKEDDINELSTKLPVPDDTGIKSTQQLEITTVRQEITTESPELQTKVSEDTSEHQPTEAIILALDERSTTVPLPQATRAPSEEKVFETVPSSQFDHTTESQLEQEDTATKSPQMVEEDLSTSEPHISVTDETRISDTDVITKEPQTMATKEQEEGDIQSLVTESQDITTKVDLEESHQSETTQHILHSESTEAPHDTELHDIRTAVPQESSTSIPETEDTNTESLDHHEELSTKAPEQEQTESSIPHVPDEDVNKYTEEPLPYTPEIDMTSTKLPQTNVEPDVTEQHVTEVINVSSHDATESNEISEKTTKAPETVDTDKYKTTTEIFLHELTTEGALLDTESQEPEIVTKISEATTAKVSEDASDVTSKTPEIYKTEKQESFTDYPKEFTGSQELITKQPFMPGQETGQTESPEFTTDETIGQPEVPVSAEDTKSQTTSATPVTDSKVKVTLPSDTTITEEGTTPASLLEEKTTISELAEKPEGHDDEKEQPTESPDTNEITQDIAQEPSEKPITPSILQEDQHAEELDSKITKPDKTVTEKSDTFLTEQPSIIPEDYYKPEQVTEPEQKITDQQDISTEEPFISPVTDKIPSKPYIPVQQETTYESATEQPDIINVIPDVEPGTQTPATNDDVETETKIPDRSGLNEATEVSEHMDTESPYVKVPETATEVEATQPPELFSETPKIEDVHKDEQPQSTETPTSDILEDTKEKMATEEPEIFSTKRPAADEVPEMTPSPEIPEEQEKESVTTERIIKQPSEGEQEETSKPDKYSTLSVIQETTVASVELKDIAKQTTESEVTESGTPLYATSAPESHVKEPQEPVTETSDTFTTESHDIGVSVPQEKLSPEKTITEGPQEVSSVVPEEKPAEETPDIPHDKKPEEKLESPQDTYTKTPDETSTVLLEVATEATQTVIPMEPTQEVVSVKPQVSDTELQEEEKTPEEKSTEKPDNEGTSILPDEFSTGSSMGLDTAVTEPTQYKVTEAHIEEVTSTVSTDEQENITFDDSQEKMTTVLQESPKQPPESSTRIPQDITLSETDLEQRDKYTVDISQETTPVVLPDVVTDAPKRQETGKPEGEGVEMHLTTLKTPQTDVVETSPEQVTVGFEQATEEPTVHETQEPDDAEKEIMTDAPVLSTQETTADKQTMPDVVELVEHSHKPVEDISTIATTEEGIIPDLSQEHDEEKQKPQVTTEKQTLVTEIDEEKVSIPSDEFGPEITMVTTIDLGEIPKSTLPPSNEKDDQYTDVPTTSQSGIQAGDQRFDDDTSPKDQQPTQPSSIPDTEIPVQTEKVLTDKVPESELSHETTMLVELGPVTTQATAEKETEEGLTQKPEYGKPLEEIPQEKPIEKPQEEPDEKPLEEPTEKPMVEPEQKPLDETEPTEKPAKEPEVKPSETPLEEPTMTPLAAEEPQVEDEDKLIKPLDQAEEKPTETPEEKLEEEAEEKPTETPEFKPLEEPTELLQEKPLKEVEDKSTEKPLEESDKMPEKKPEEKPLDELERISTEKPELEPLGPPEEKPQEFPEGEPQQVPEEKPLKEPEEKPQDVSDDTKPLELPEEKPQEQPEEKPLKATEEKPLETPEEKPQEIPEEKPQTVPEEKPVDVSEAKPQEMPGEKQQEVPEETPAVAEEKPDVPEGKPQELPEEQPQKIPDETTEMPEEKPQELPEEKPQEVPEQKPEIPEDKLQEVPEQKPEGPKQKPQELPEGKPQELPEEKPQELPEKKPQELPEEKPEVPTEQPQEMLEEKPEVPEKTPQEIPAGKPEEPEEKPQDVPKETPQELPEPEAPTEIPQELPEEKPQEVPKEKPQEVPEEKPEEHPHELPEPKPQEEPEEKPAEPASTASPEISKPGFGDTQPTDEVPDDDNQFPPSGGTSGYGTEHDYVEEDQAFGPGTCRYGGKVYVSAQQIPRDDPCDFCFCFRSDIICLQQSCPPPIHGCHEEPIQGFCCPRYECPVAMATTLNVTTTTTTTTTTLPPHFLPHAYKGAAQRRGCQIKGHTYKVGEVVRASSGPCLHCTCGGDGQMKCDPKACTPEPMLRQMIAAAVSAKRRR